MSYRSGHTYSCEWTAEVEGEERDVLLTYSYTAGTAEYIPRNECPSKYDPGSGAEICIITCDDLENGNSYILDNEQIRKAEEFIEDKHLDDDPDEPDTDWRNDW